MGWRKGLNKQKHDGFPVHGRQWLWCTNITKSVKRAKMQQRAKGQKRFFVFLYFFVICGKFRRVSPYLDTAQQPQEQRDPFLPVCAVFPCVHTMVWLPVFVIFNVRADVDACHCTQGLYGHCTGSWLGGKKIPCPDYNRNGWLGVKHQVTQALPHRGLEPASALRLALQSDALPTELSRPANPTFRW